MIKYVVKQRKSLNEYANSNSSLGDIIPSILVVLIWTWYLYVESSYGISSW